MADDVAPWLRQEIKAGDRVAFNGGDGVVLAVMDRWAWVTTGSHPSTFDCSLLTRIVPERKPGDVVRAKHDYGEGPGGHCLLQRVTDGWLSYNPDDDRPREVYFLRDEDISDE